MTPIIRKTLAFVVVILFSCPLFVLGQTTVWSVDFNNGCSSACVANTYGGWTIQNNVGGVSGGSANEWFVSCAENGQTPPACGAGCAGDASLHIGANAGGLFDLGASFNETGAANATYKLVVSPTINLSGYTSNTLAFDFIAYGSAGCSDDRGQLRLSIDNGATWPAGYQYCLTSVCCGACNGYNQGQWTVYTLALPAAFDNNPNVRVAFHWRNNGNGSGTDPSIAIDDIRITNAGPMASLTEFRGKPLSQGARLTWTSSSELKLNRYELERSTEPRDFRKIATMSAKGQGHNDFLQYSYEDSEPLGNEVYYRLRMVDEDGTANYSSILRIKPGSNSILDLSSLVVDQRTGSLNVSFWATGNVKVNAEVTDMTGKLIARQPVKPLTQGENKITYELGKLAKGNYFLRIVPASALPEGAEPVRIVRQFQVLD